MKKFISIMAMATVLLWSCQEKDGPEEVAPGSIALAGSVTDGQIIAGPEGGEFSVNVTSSEGWRVSGISDWVTLSSESGKSGQPLTFTVDPSEETEARTATFKVFSADAVEAVTIIQHPLYTISLASDEVVNVNSDANQISVSLVSNVEELDVDFGGAEGWIKLNDVTDAFGKKIVKFDVVRSSEFKERAAELTIKGANTDDVVKVTVNQAQRDTAFVEGEQRIIKGLEAMQLDLVLRSNVSVSYSVPSWIKETHGDMSAEKDEYGLYSRSVTMTADASAGSRAASIIFRSSGVAVGSLFVKQQNPNPVYVDIPDDNLRLNLVSQEWIIEDEGTKCELLENGINGTSLVIGQTDPNAWGTDPIESIEGLEGFPNIESLTLGSLTVGKVDVSKFPKLKELKLINLCNVYEINTGSLPIANISDVAGNYTYMLVNELVIKGDNIENIDFSASGYYMTYESLASVDVTGCPKLATLNVLRYNSYWGEASPLKYVYMTAAQAESVAVTKLDAVEIVVK